MVLEELRIGWRAQRTGQMRSLRRRTAPSIRPAVYSGCVRQPSSCRFSRPGSGPWFHGPRTRGGGTPVGTYSVIGPPSCALTHAPADDPAPTREERQDLMGPASPLARFSMTMRELSPMCSSQGPPSHHRHTLSTRSPRRRLRSLDTLKVVCPQPGCVRSPCTPTPLREPLFGAAAA